MTVIDYDHAKNPHGLNGPRAALQFIFAEEKPTSMVDVGCGAGTWLRAALDLGVKEVFGIDGVISPDLHVPRDIVKQIDFSEPFDLGCHFDVGLCLEVAEHLPEACADGLIASLVGHAHRILFSAAVPKQPGQHHVNCQWPVYWQNIFNRRGYICDDDIRWKLWNNDDVEPWYRQNIFWAIRKPELAGHEPRLLSVIHPQMIDGLSLANVIHAKEELANGGERIEWYILAALKKIKQKLIPTPRWT